MVFSESSPACASGVQPRGQDQHPVHFVFRVLLAANFDDVGRIPQSGRPGFAAFTWDKLEGAEVVMFSGGQPVAMLHYACHKAGIDFNRIRRICPGGAAEIDRAFRNGQGRYVHQQGPYPQQLQADGIGHVVAQVGKQIGPCGFSSLAATRDWLETDMAKRFIRAYRQTRIYMNEAPAAEIARAERPYFPDIDEHVLADCIATYQQLGCWTPHVQIARAAFEKTLDVFEHAGLLKQRYRYEQVCAAPPATN